MPAQRPTASFEPIPPDFNLSALVEKTPNFQYVDRISVDMIDQQGLDAFDKLVLLHVVIGGKPLVIDGYEQRLDPWTFSPKWLADNHGEKVETTRDLTKNESIPMTVGHYLKHMGGLTDQYYEKRDNYKNPNRQRIYLKDIDCPPVWTDKLRENLPPNLFYLNETTGVPGGPGATMENAPTGGKRQGRGIAGAGDLMSSLPSSMRAENMMCYIGHEGTYTPAHREMCASLGHNIMVECSDVLGDEGKPEKPGSSIWFMTESKDKDIVSEYWLSILGHDIEVERHFAQVAAWQAAPFTVYVVEQRTGDFILIPPLAPHQVWNRGTRTMKAAWNRTTVETLEMAVNEALPRARMVCRDEQYKNKAIIYTTLQKYSILLAKVRDQQQTSPSPQEAQLLRKSHKIRQLEKDFKRLFDLYKKILLSEMFAPETTERCQFMPFESNITCAYCRGNIFNRFLTCNSCENALNTPEPEPYDICMDCYVMGRSCGCISKLKWVEQFKWKELATSYETWRRQYIDLEVGKKQDPPGTIQEERAKLTKKTLAQICQGEIKHRPWVDINKAASESEEETDGETMAIDPDGTVRHSRKKYKRSDTWLKKTRPCHVCCGRHEKWKMAECAKCGRNFCYGTLFRGHDLMPQQVMEQEKWHCPHCKGICSAGNCRKDPRQKSYKPKGTLLGHDTRKVADARSVESLVDFSKANLQWLGESVQAPTNNQRLQKRQEEASRAKRKEDELNDHYATDDEAQANAGAPDARSRIQYTDGSDFLDPALRELDTGSPSNARNAPTVASLLNGDQSQIDESGIGPDDDGYEPAAQNDTGFVAPSAVMYQPPQDEDADSDLDSMELDPSIVSPPKKRRADQTADGIKRAPPKKRRRDDTVPVSGATKQFRKEQERKALEEARKQGRYIQVSAALKGRSKVIKLALGRQNLLRIKAQYEGQDANILVRSDVKPPEQAPVFRAGDSSSAKHPKQVRIRVEHDDDFGARRRRSRKSGGAGSARNRTHAFENINVESDTEAEQDSDADLETAQADGAVDSASKPDRRRGSSLWQRQHHEAADERLLVELPENWKDGRKRNPPKARVPPSQRKTAGKSVPGLRPSSNAKAAPATVDVSDDNEQQEDEYDDIDNHVDDEEDDDDGPDQNQSSLAAAALRQAEDEENRLAKLEAGGLVEEDEDDENAEDDGDAKHAEDAEDAEDVEDAEEDEDEQDEAQMQSIRARKGPGGRKIRIVSSSARQKTNGDVSVKAKVTTPNKTATREMVVSPKAGRPRGRPRSSG
ncbi:MAG: hypothetical protein M1828_007293 [Chrysothrix sp. TS-e1954]|nr:MAG: hypothetical protein M1828_007293 [Chrysothrix sp. TS-e1954]